MLIKLFLTFFKIGAFTFGGGYAMIPIIKKEIVDKNKWLEEKEFIDALAIVQGSPGPVAVNTSIYIGYKVGGFFGALAALLGTVLPSFFIILIIATFFMKFRENIYVEKMFKGVRPAIVALIVSAVYNLYRTVERDYLTVIIAIVTLILISGFNISPIILIIAAGVGGILLKNRQ